jgi:hypothetical protein
MSADDWLIPVHRRARALLNVDRPHEAGKHLARALRRLDPVLAPPQPLLISVAALFAGTPFPGIDATSRFEWGRYAHRASTRFPNDLRLLITAADAYEQVLGEYGLTFDVMLVRRQRLASQQRHGTEADIVLAQRDLALALHGDGWCHEARTDITNMLAAWHIRPTSHAAGVTLTLSAAVIHAACGRRDQAISILRGNARLLPVPGTEAAARAAEWLAGAEKHHPRICEDPQQPDITQTSGDRVLFWLTAIATHYQHPPMHCSDIIVPDPHRSQP